MNNSFFLKKSIIMLVTVGIINISASVRKGSGDFGFNSVCK